MSYDLNYRPSLWQGRGGLEAARGVNRAQAPLVDIMVGNEEDFTACLGFAVPETGPELDALEAANFRLMIADVVADYRQLSVVATTLRTVRSATIYDWARSPGRPRSGSSMPSIGATSRSSIASAAATALPRG